MTLIVAVTSKDSIWLMADRRLSFQGRQPRDNARKLMFLETQDGTAILGYCGLGVTAAGTEPADWMSAVLRGRNVPLEQSLAFLFEALQQEFPRHLSQLSRGQPIVHDIVVPAFLNGAPRLYSVGIIANPDGTLAAHRFTRFGTPATEKTIERAPRIGLGGSGAISLWRNRKKWQRDLLRIIDRANTLKIYQEAVADKLASLNYWSHKNTTDGTVSQQCIVAWRNRKGSHHKMGGAQQFYDGEKRVFDDCSIPTIGNGMDISSLISVLHEQTVKHGILNKADASDTTIPEAYNSELSAALSKIPDYPDSKLK